MTPTDPKTAPVTADAATHGIDAYRAVWRWHFYAGLLVLPFMILLAVTGGLYLYRDEIDRAWHHQLKQVDARPGQEIESSRLIEAALAAHPGTAAKFMPPPTPTSSAEVTVKAETGQRLAVYVDPYDGRVLGSLPDRGTIMWTIRRLHSLAEFGPIANGIIEIVGGWSILLVGTGLFLWWPRRQSGGVVTIRGDARKRVFWRDLHAVTGAFTGLFIAFLAISGMPWSVFWGKYANEWANGTNYGYPAGLYVDVPMSDEHLAHAGETSWSLQQAQVPMSTAPAEPPAPVGIDAAVATFDRLGVVRGYVVSLPSGPTGVYSASVYPDDIDLQRVVHLDQYTGEPLLDFHYADYGPIAKAMELGINLHLGQQFGWVNQLVLVLVCVATVLMAMSAGVMWWKRRPKGSMGVPPLPSDRGRMWGIIVIMAVVGVLYPLVGASLIVMLLIDLIITRGWRSGGGGARRTRPETRPAA